MKNRLGIFYIVLVVMLLILGTWWLFFLTQVGQDQAEAKLQKLANDRIHAAFLLEAEPRVRQDPQGLLGPSFPHLKFTRSGGSVTVEIDPEVVRQIQEMPVAAHYVLGLSLDRALDVPAIARVRVDDEQVELPGSQHGKVG